MMKRVLLCCVGMLVMLAVQPAQAGMLMGYDLNESYPPDLSGNHGLYGHGASIDNTDAAPGGYSTESARHDLTSGGVEPDGAFYGLTGSFAGYTGPAMTWAIWMKIDSSQWVSNHHTAVAAFAAGNLYDNQPGEVMIWFEDTYLRPHVNLGGIGNLGGAAALPLDQWVHLAATFCSGQATLYVNGDPVDSQDYSGSATVFPALAGREGWLGTAPNNGGLTEGMMGWTDEFVWYDDCLDEADVELLMQVGIEVFPEPATMLLLGLGGFAAIRRRR